MQVDIGCVDEGVQVQWISIRVIGNEWVDRGDLVMIGIGGVEAAKQRLWLIKWD